MLFFSFFTVMMKFSPCLDGSYYRDRTVIPKPINTCREYYMTFIVTNLIPWCIKTFFSKDQVLNKVFSSCNTDVQVTSNNCH